MTKEKSNKKSFKNQKVLLVSGGVVLLILITCLIIFLCFNSSKQLKLSNFEKIAVYGYLEDYLDPSKLYILSGKSNLDELQYTQLQVKKAIDEYVNKTGADTIPTSIISSYLAENELIKDANVDFHGIVVPDYEYLPEENAYIKADGANSGVAFIESDPSEQIYSNLDLKVNSIEEEKGNKYKVYFNLLDKETVVDSGNVVLSITDNSTFNIDSCVLD